VIFKPIQYVFGFSGDKKKRKISMAVSISIKSRFRNRNPVPPIINVKGLFFNIEYISPTFFVQWSYLCRKAAVPRKYPPAPHRAGQLL